MTCIWATDFLSLSTYSNCRRILKTLAVAPNFCVRSWVSSRAYLYRFAVHRQVCDEDGDGDFFHPYQEESEGYDFLYNIDKNYSDFLPAQLLKTEPPPPASPKEGGPAERAGPPGQAAGPSGGKLLRVQVSLEFTQILFETFTHTACFSVLFLLFFQTFPDNYNACSKCCASIITRADTCVYDRQRCISIQI